MTCCSGSSAGDGNYPSTCFTGGCGCAPEHSTEVAACDCPVGKCFDSDVNKCVDEHEEF